MTTPYPIPHTLYPARCGQASRPRSGQATLGFIFVVASIIIAVSISFVFIIVSLINSGFAYQAAEQASLAAHSGVEDALLILTRNKDFTSAGYTLTVGPSKVLVSVLPNTPVAGQISILSKASVGTNSRQSQAIITIAPSTSAMNILSWSEAVQSAQAAAGGTIIASSPSGIALNVDGAGCTSPCSFLWNSGDAHTITASSTVAGSAGTQYIYTGWSDGGAMSHSITVPSSSVTYTANFATQYFLTTTANPGAGGSISPSSQWYNTGSSPSVSSSPNGGYSFAGFSGAISGTITPRSITVSGAMSVIANFTHIVPWYAGGSWGYRQAITIDHTKVASSTGTEAYTNFPVLVNVTSTNFRVVASGGHVGNSDGSDVLFTNSDGTTKVNHEIESYSSSTGNLVAWVQMPAVSTSTDTVFYMYYGNAGVGNQQNVAGTWNANYKGVWHLPNGTTLTALDSTSNANNGTINGAPGAISGQIAGAANFSASADRLAITTTTLSGVAYTISTWFTTPMPGSCSSYCTLTRGTSDHEVIVNPSNLLGEYDNVGATGFHSSGFNVTTLSSGWHYLTAAVIGTSTAFYMDGVSVGNSNIKSNDDIVSIANYQGGGQQWGKTDEFRISNIARSADWIKTEYKNQSTPASFETFGSEETQ